jgi:hypothetical protein
VNAVRTIGKLIGVLAGAILLAGLAGAAPAAADSAWWELNSGSIPTNLPASGPGEITLVATNLGDADVQATGTPVTIADKLPAGLTATAISGGTGPQVELSVYGAVSCTLATLSCTYEGSLPPYEQLAVTIDVEVTGPVSGSNEATMVGGDTPSVSVKRPMSVGGAPTEFGVEGYEAQTEDSDGSPDTQAGSHPFQVTTTVLFDRSAEAPFQPALPKDLHFKLPPGLIGNPTPFPQCTEAQFSQYLPNTGNECPTDTVVGVAMITIDEKERFGEVTIPVPLFNLVPAQGEPARFGFEIFQTPVLLDTSVRTGGDYGVTVNVSNITQVTAFLDARVTFWGVPGDSRHDPSRGWACLFEEVSCPPQPAAPAPPLLTLPTACAGPLQTTVEADSWADPGAFVSRPYTFQDGSGQPFGMDGCNRLAFEPSIAVAPDGQAGSTPTGLSVDVHVPQETILSASALAQSNVKDTTVTLPAGVQLSPGSADGLQSCSLAQISLETAGPPTCPEASKVGTVELKSPLLAEELQGAVYLAAQDANPFGSLVAMYILAEAPKAGIVVKFAGEVALDERTGQIVSTFKNTPQLPFEDLKLHFFGSARAPLTTPPLCGSYTTRASFAPWSGNAPAEPTSTFQITSGPNGSPCASPRPFSPGFQAGSTNLQAGAFTPFTLTMGRPDADQTLAGLSVQLPPGLSGDLSGVQLCPEPQASTGDCPAGSLIGHTVVSAGLGNAPFTVEGGQVFITGPYKGAPFGLSILNPAKAGPFDLGHVVVRAKIEVDPTTAALHIASDPLPTIIDGIPLQIQHVNVTVDRPGFTFNPTSCNPMKLTGTMTSTEGASASVATPFQVTNCASLSFRPGFTVSTSGKPSRLNGESLDVKLTYPSGSAGTQANIAKVKVELPKRLPSRLPTLQKACLEATFNANPENCPAASKVGEAVASTPILAGGLSGPAYFVSYGNAKFPELVVVLRGEDGVTVDLHGETFISKQGVTSSTFNTVPDVPVGSFELKLPEGRYSALAAIGNPCKGKLTMPTEFVAQNGAVVHQTTKIQVTGCPRTKAKVKKKTHHKKAAGHSRAGGKPAGRRGRRQAGR